MNGSIITVSQLNRYVKSVLDSDGNLKSVFLVGEISNFKINSFSGHAYLTLKDENSSVKAVMFKSSALRLKFIPQDGMRVICRGDVNLYERDGAYQFYINDIQPDGAGSIALHFEQLKEKLAKEGLFASDKKQSIPHFPKKIAVITSGTGAAVQDMINVLGRRWPLATLVMCPVKVQGEGSAEQMIEALADVNLYTDCDVIIIGRGGGSAEDLWCFNDENLARAVSDSKIPVISAVGHETDFTICDFAADLRAPTPSAAAELAVPDITEIMAYVLGINVQLNTFFNSYLNTAEQKLKALSNRPVLINPFSTVETLCLRLDNLKSRLDAAFNKKTAQSDNSLTALTAKLDALNPAKILLRGYSIAEVNEKAVKSVDDIKCGEEIKLIMSDGFAECTVNSKIRSKCNE